MAFALFGLGGRKYHSLAGFRTRTPGTGAFLCRNILRAQRDNREVYGTNSGRKQGALLNSSKYMFSRHPYIRGAQPPRYYDCRSCFVSNTGQTQGGP
jgi:hypothetical protein